MSVDFNDVILAHFSFSPVSLSLSLSPLLMVVLDYVMIVDRKCEVDNEIRPLPI